MIYITYTFRENHLHVLGFIPISRIHVSVRFFFYEYPISAIDNHKKNFYVGSYDMTDLVLVTLKDDDELRLDLCKMTL